MPVEQALRIVDGAGLVVLDIDASGPKNRQGHMLNPDKYVTAQLLAGSLDGYIWECIEGVYVVTAVRALVSTAGGSGAQVDVKVCAGLTAPASGTTQLAAVLTLTTTGPSRADGTLIATPTSIFPGDSIALDFGGTLTALVGHITVQIKRTQ